MKVIGQPNKEIKISKRPIKKNAEKNLTTRELIRIVTFQSHRNNKQYNTKTRQLTTKSDIERSYTGKNRVIERHKPNIPKSINDTLLDHPLETHKDKNIAEKTTTQRKPVVYSGNSELINLN